MSRNQILVRNINHLTDARYFAAMGVDWMSMQLNEDPVSFMRWHALKDWVEGVKLAAELTTTDEMVLAKTVIDAKPDGIVLRYKPGSEVPQELQLIYDATSDIGSDYPQGSFRIISYDLQSDPQAFLALDPPTTFLQAAWTPEKLSALLTAGYNGGICFSGGEEDATGMRDYEMMDELLGILNSIEG